MDAATEIERITQEIMALGQQIEVKRKEALAIVRGLTATDDRHGDKFRIEATRIAPGSWRLFLDGPLLKKDGSAHARNRVSVPIGLISLSA